MASHGMSSSAEKGPSIKSVETSKLIVSQPPKMKELGRILDTLETYTAKISERSGEDASSDLGGASTGSGGQQGSKQISPRDYAIQNLPAMEVMQQKLAAHIRKEARKLEGLARSAEHQSGPGSAHQLNAIYAKIRRLNMLIYELLETSVEVLKRLFIRVFIDQQTIL